MELWATEYLQRKSAELTVAEPLPAKAEQLKRRSDPELVVADPQANVENIAIAGEGQGTF